ncbi:helix-turn-helix domain-containing protein [Terrisporobacter petrolearius]|uniref:helix-turn-helix domain-containing protein n=1 Tax=Terrisporobacter petrolearius TaxID=1460447 RepID=UPI0031CC7BF9
MNNFSKNLKLLRTKNSITSKDLGKYIDVTQQSLSKYEKGLANPNFYTLMSIATFFNCSLDDLVFKDLSQVPMTSLETSINSNEINKLSDNQKGNLGIEVTQTKLDNLNAEIKIAQTKLDNLNTEIKIAQTKLDNLNLEIKDKKNKFNNLNSEIKNTKKEFNNLDLCIKEQFNNLNLTIKDAKKEFDSLNLCIKEQFNNLNSEIKDKKNKLDNLNSDKKNK